MPHRLFCLLLALSGLLAPAARAGAPALLTTALERWHAGEGEWAFTQHTRLYRSDGTLKEERVERYDPSLPDSQRWRLLEVDGQPATAEQQTKWDGHKNGKPRKRADRGGFADFLDLEHATLLGETPRLARYKVAFKPDASHFVDLDEVEIVVAVNKDNDTVAGVGATLREPMRMLLGLAKITHLDVDLHLATTDGGAAGEDDIQSGSTASVKISRLGRPAEYDWSDFKRVAAFAGP